MATQIVMDHTGDTRHQFDAEDLEALALGFEFAHAEGLTRFDW